jgi:acyl carrier protein
MEKVNNIIAEILKVSIAEAKENSSMYDVSEWDSLTHMNLIVAIENEFNIEISGDDIAEMVSFDAIRNTVAKYV